MTTNKYWPLPIQQDPDVTCFEHTDAFLRRVPALEIFGSASIGWKARMYIHGAFVYLLVSQDGTEPAENEMRELAASLDSAVSEVIQSAESNQQHVCKMTVMSCIKLHGHQTEKGHFLKLSFSRPADVCRAAELLLEGPVMSQLFKPSEPSKPWPMQAITDHTLLDIISAAAFRFRRQVKDSKNGRRKKDNVANRQHEDSQTTVESLLGEYVTLKPVLEPRRKYVWHEQNALRLECDLAELENPWNLDIMDTDDSDSNDETDYIPQFDGASDKNPGMQKKSDQSQVPTAINQTTASVHASEDSSKSQTSGGVSDSSSAVDLGWRAGRGMGNSQNCTASSVGSWAQQGWPQQTGAASGSWHGQSQSWQQQQQQYQNWQHQQHMSPAFPSPQTPFRSPSPATSFQSPPHSQYASPTHQPSYQTPSPSQHQYQYPHFQSPPASHSYQQPYQGPSPHTCQSPGSGQTFHSPQSYHSSSPGQPYQSLGASNQSFQSATSVKPYSSPSSNQLYQSQPANQPYQSPPANHSFQSPQGNPYQPASSQMYPSYQSSSHCHQTSHPQTYPHPYQSPSHDGCYPNNSAWSPQTCSGYYQGNLTGYGTGSQNTSGKHLNEPSQAAHHQPGMVYRQSGHQTSSGQGSEFNAQCAQQQGDVALSGKPPSTHNMAGLETQGNQTNMPQTQQKKTYKKRKENSKSGGTRMPQLQSKSPTSVIIAKSPVELSCSSAGTPSANSEANAPQTESQEYARGSQDNAGDGTSFASSGSKCSDMTPVTKISTLEFKPDITTSSVPSVNKESSVEKSVDLVNIVTSVADVEKVETNTSTPMIQQLLMEEPIRMNIKKEARDAVMKKPMASPTPPKPKRKYKSRVNQGAKPAGRPRSTSMTSPSPSLMGYCGYSPRPIMSPPVLGKPARSHSLSLPFICQSRTASPMQSYDWQQWKQQQNFPPSSQWQQKQQWELNEWEGFDIPTEHSCSTGDMGGELGPMFSRLQHRSFSVDAVQSSLNQKTSQSNQITPFCDSQSAFQNNSNFGPKSSADANTSYSSQGNVSDKSSLSSLFQLVSDVGSGDISWENATVSVPNLFFNSNDSETPRSTATPDLNPESPPGKDFITLETPCKQDSERANSDITGMTSSEESDRVDFDISCDLRPRAVSRSHSLGDGQCRVGKQNRLRKLGLLHTRSTDVGSVICPMGSNPAYTYTFHVPTTVFKKLKFFRTPESREKNVKVVRMHPMDARRYSLLKIGREIVKATRLSESDLAGYNVTLPAPSHFVLADGCTNRVNLDIPTVSVDKRSSDNGGEESSFSRFDTDFPPNKVAPPSSFDASQMSASMARASSTATRSSPVGSDWMRQFAGHQAENYNGGFSPGSRQSFNTQGNFSSSQQAERSLNAYTSHQQMSQNSMNRQFGYQQSEVLSGVSYHQFGQKRGSYVHMAPSSSNPQEYHPGQQAEYMNHSVYPHHQHYPQYQQQQPIQQQLDPSGSLPEPKNGLRSPGQHGLASRIDSGGVHGHSGDQENKNDKSTTETPHFNSRVNAQRWNNHAEHEANYAALHCTNVCTFSHQSHFEQCQSTVDSPGTASYADLSVQNEQSQSINQLIEKEEFYKERHSSMKMSRALHCHSFDTEESSNGREDQMIRNNLGTSVNDSSKLSELPKFKNHDDSSSFNSKCDLYRDKLSCRKNIKLLSLTIPKPPLIPNHIHVNRIQSSQKHIEMNFSTQKDSDGAGVGDSRDFFTIRRSTRSSKQADVKSIAGSRHRPRQAKLRSIYSKYLYKLKPKKKRKRQPLVEGVHYIVVGKFKGHQSMLVRVKKLHIEPMERVCADVYEKRAAQEIIRVVSPKSYLELDEKFEPNNPNSLTENQSGTEAEQQLTCENAKYQETTSGSRVCRPASKRRLKQRTKFRSAHIAILKSEKSMNDMALKILPESMPKNVLAGPSNGASENNVENPFFLHENFFSRFKEGFLRHKLCNQTGGYDCCHHKNAFFEGVRLSSFHNFQQKLVENVQKLRNDDYSSSSDDEDDVLDETILREKFGMSQVLEIFQLTNKVSSSDSLKHGYSVLGTDWKIGQTVADDKVCMFLNKSCRNELKFDSLKNWNDRFQERIEIESGQHSVKEGSSVEQDDPCLPMSDIECSVASKTRENNIDQSKVSQSPVACSDANSNCLKDEEEKEDYLKCQMAFFEDISSDSNSNDTIIMDSYMEKEKAFHINSVHFPTLSHTVSRPKGYTVSVHPQDVVIRQEDIPGIMKEVLAEDGDLLASNISIPCKPTEQKEACSCDKKVGNSEVSPLSRSNHRKENELRINLDKDVTQLSGVSVSGMSEEVSENTFRLTNVQKDPSNVSADILCDLEDISPASEHATFDLNVSVCVSKDNSSTTGHCTTSSCPDEMREIDCSHKLEDSVFTGRLQKQNRLVKDMKVKRPQERKHADRRLKDAENSSSDDEADLILESQNKRLRQRKQVRYRIYPEELESTEEDSGGSSDDFTAVSQRKGLRRFRKLKAGDCNDRQTKNLSQVNVDIGRATRGRHKVQSSRGRRKKPPGGDKLLSSLSLLHMATLANLTETQSDPVADQTASETLTVAESEKYNLKHLEGSNSRTGTLTSQDHSFFISSQNSGDFETSQPLTQSSSDKKKWRNRGRSTSGGSASSKRLMRLSCKQASLKPGCNGTSNLGSKPLPISKFLSNVISSSSPVPSNFSFDHISDSSFQPELASSAEDANTTSHTLQLLQTRRAQINCASFSMKDILKLTTPDDSVDSDSKDSAALVGPSEPKRAQVKSTALFMSDILKLTSVDNSSKTSSSQTSSATLALLLDPDCKRSQPSSETSEALISQVTFSNTQPLLESSGDSCNLQHQKIYICKMQESMLKVSDLTGAHLANEGTTLPEAAIKSAEVSEPLLSQKPDSHKTGSYHPETSDTSPVSHVSVTGKKSMIASDRGNVKTVQTSASASDHMLMPHCSDADKSSSVLEKGNGSGKVTDDSSEDDSNYRASVIDRIKKVVPELNHNLATQVTASSGVTPPLKVLGSKKDAYESETQKSSITLHDVMSEAPAGEPFTSQSAPHHIQQDKGGAENVENSGMSESMAVTESLQQAAKIKKIPSTSSAQANDKSDSDPVQTSHNHHQPLCKIPETSVTSVSNYPQISLVSNEPALALCSSSKPLPMRLKEDKERNCKNMNVKHTEREMRPLHPLQIPSYSSCMNHSGTSQTDRLQDSVRNTSVYYPYCWQWPVHTPGSDTAVGPLNLCTTQKSPNNYSPITPTSPVSPNYPTQAQGTTASDLSPPAKMVKPLWYPWLTVDSSSRQETKVSTSISREHSSHDYSALGAGDFRSPVTSASSLSELEQTVHAAYQNDGGELAQTGPRKVKHGNKVTSYMQKIAPKKLRYKFFSPSQSISAKVNNKLSGGQIEVQEIEAAVEVTKEIGSRNTPSAGSSVNFAGADPGLPSEISSVVTLDVKQSSRLKESGGQCSVSESVYWNGDNAVTPDSIECSSNISFAAGLVNRTQPVISGATDESNLPHGDSSGLAIIGEHKQDGQMFKNRRKKKGRLRQSCPINRPLSLGTVDNGQLSLTERLMAQLTRSGDSKFCHQKPLSRPPDAFQTNKLEFCSSQKRHIATVSKCQPLRDHLSQKQRRDENSESHAGAADNRTTSELEPGRAAHPARSPHAWNSVEESLQATSIRSQHSPLTLCTGLQELPDKPLYLKCLHSPLQST